MTNRSIGVSVVIPVYGCAACLNELHAQIAEALKGIDTEFEIILVDDGSDDGSWEVIRALADRRNNIVGVRLSRNFGQHAAITAGLAHARGRFVVVMDCDLQDDPADIPRLLDAAAEGYDIVYTRKRKRRHSAFKNWTARLFTLVFNYLSDSVDTRGDVGSFSLISRRVVSEFLRIRDQHRHYLMILRWIGLPCTHVDVEHRARPVGRSSYSIGKLLSHAVDGITSQSTKALRFSVSVGLFFCVLAAIAIIWMVIAYLIYGFQEGWASTIALLLLSSGLILMSLGITGIYIGNIFDQVRERPLFIVWETVNVEPSQEAQIPRGCSRPEDVGGVQS